MTLASTFAWERTALAGWSSCTAGDAPTEFLSAGCGTTCTESGSVVTCDTRPLCGTQNVAATIVTLFGSSSHDLSAFGVCGGAVGAFCCVYDEGSTNIDTVSLIGTDQSDELLAFTYDKDQPGEENLYSWDGDPIDGFIRGQDGGDSIRGSNVAETDYRDNLYGGRGPDDIQGFRGRDFLCGGDGEDILSGGDANDTLWGGDGADALYGESGDDKLCDASGYQYCVNQNNGVNGDGNFMDGGTGADVLWYDQGETVSCPTQVIDPASTAGTGTDECGDSSNWTSSPGSGELPGQCDSNYISTKPAKCEGAE